MGLLRLHRMCVGLSLSDCMSMSLCLSLIDVVGDVNSRGRDWQRRLGSSSSRSGKPRGGDLRIGQRACRQCKKKTDKTNKHEKKKCDHWQEFEPVDCAFRVASITYVNSRSRLAKAIKSKKKSKRRSKNCFKHLPQRTPHLATNARVERDSAYLLGGLERLRKKKLMKIQIDQQQQNSKFLQTQTPKIPYPSQQRRNTPSQ